jgi:hypothetical protein
MYWLNDSQDNKEPRWCAIKDCKKYGNFCILHTHSMPIK